MATSFSDWLVTFLLASGLAGEKPFWTLPVPFSSCARSSAVSEPLLHELLIQEDMMMIARGVKLMTTVLMLARHSKILFYFSCRHS